MMRSWTPKAKIYMEAKPKGQYATVAPAVNTANSNTDLPRGAP